MVLSLASHLRRRLAIVVTAAAASAGSGATSIAPVFVLRVFGPLARLFRVRCMPDTTRVIKVGGRDRVGHYKVNQCRLRAAVVRVMDNQVWLLLGYVVGVGCTVGESRSCIHQHRRG